MATMVMMSFHACMKVRSDLVPIRSLAIFLSFALWTSMAEADSWPMWRGARLDGVSRESSPFPTRWSATENISWKCEIPGRGHSSPIVWGDRIFLTSCIEGKGERILICVDRIDGRLVWQKTVLRAPLERKHNLNSFASSTPATDGSHIWVTFLDQPYIRVACFDMDGNQVWQKTPGKFNSPHGFCSSPIVYENKVIVNCDQDNQEAFIVALDKAAGEEIYRIDRPNRTRSYCVPLIVRAAGKMQMVLTGSKCVASYDPDTGKQIWIVDGPTEQFVASVVYTDDMFIITGGFPEHHILGIRPDGTGNVTDTHIAWRTTRNTSYVPSPIAHRRLFYIVSDEGIASCYEPKTGKMLWNQRLSRHVSASLVAAGDWVYVLDDSGVMHVLKAGPKFEVIAKNALNEECRASPALSHGQIFVRTAQNLYCIGKSIDRK
jgi:outer membrane protein assembly factor BamB